MSTRIVDMQPQVAARWAGLLYLLIIAGGLFAEAFVRGALITPGDPAATAAHILDHESLYRVGFAVHLAYLGCAFLPRLLGWLMVLAGLCYLVNSFAGFLSPALGSRLFPWILLPSLVAELSLALWLLVKGVDVNRLP